MADGTADGMARVAAAFRERAEAKSQCLASLREYSRAFYRELARLLGTLRAQGIDVASEPTTAPLSDGLETFAFEWEGSRVILSPSPVADQACPKSSAATALGNTLCSRIVVFLQPRGARDAAAIHEIFVSPHGRVVTEGLGYPGIGDLSEASIAGHAAGLLHRLTFEIHRWHRPLDRTTFDFATEKEEGGTMTSVEASRTTQADSAGGAERPMSSPKAFFCHSSADKTEFADRLAGDLRAAGVDVWYDQWEIAPGDSLRRKVDSGIEGATQFLALITPNSLKSEWVQTELDAGMVKKIEGTCRLIPVLAGVAVDDLPPTLRSVRCVQLEPYEAGLREVIAVCYDVSAKPPLGTPPAWAVEQPLPQKGLSVHAQRLATLLNERSEHALAATGAPDPILSIDDVVQALGMTEHEVDEAADELETTGWAILLRRNVLGLPISLGHIRPSPLLFVETDPVFKGWNPREDARALAAVMVNSGKDVMTLDEAERALAWGSRRMNATAHALKIGGHADVIGGDRAYGTSAYYGFHITAKTRRLARES